MLIIAHRGASGYALENTRASIDMAIQLGADMIEIDVRRLRDGKLAVMHDMKVDKTTNGHGYLTDFDAEAFCGLTAKNGEHPLLLEQLIEYAGQRCRILIDLKGPGTAKPASNVIKSYLKKGWRKEFFMVQSYNYHELQEFKKHSPDIEMATLMVGMPLDYAKQSEDLGAVAANVPLHMVTSQYVKDVHDRGLKMYAWEVYDADDYKYLERMGVDGIITNFPDVAHKNQPPAAKLAKHKTDFLKKVMNGLTHRLAKTHNLFIKA
jgi:glycerophosphoryl diester phosphodiesterase